MTLGIILVASVIFLCILADKLSGKIGMPALILFMFIGMLFGSDGILKIPFDDFHTAEEICSLALLFIMFYGGFNTKWQPAKTVAAKSIALSTAGVAITAGITALLCMVCLHFSHWYPKSWIWWTNRQMYGKPSTIIRRNPPLL